MHAACAVTRWHRVDPLARLNLATLLLNVTIYSPILVLFFTGRGLSLFQVLALEALNSAVVMALEIPTGVVGDRVGYKRAVILGHALQGVWLLVLIAAHTYWVFLVGYTMLGVAIALRSGATEAWVFELLRERGEASRMGQAQGSLWAWALSGRVGSALLAVVVIRASTDWYYVLALALSASVFLISAAIVATVRRVSPSPPPNGHSGAPVVRDGVNLLRNHCRLRRVALASVTTDPLPYALLFLYQPYFQASSTPLPLYGVAAAVGASVGAVAAKQAHRLAAKWGASRAFAAVVVAPAALYLIMAATRQAYAAVVLFVLTFGLMQARYPLVAAMRNPHLASHNRATVLSLISMLEGAWSLIGKLVVGRIADASLSSAFILMGVIPLICLGYFWPVDEEVDGSADRPQPP